MKEEIHSELSRFESAIERLERLFNLYFGGRERRPPVTELTALKKQARDLMNARVGKRDGAAKHRRAAMLQKFTSHRLKWEKTMKDIEEGRIRPGVGFFNTGGAVGHASKHISDGAGASQNDSGSSRKEGGRRRIDKAAEEYVSLAEKYLKKRYDPESIRAALEKKAPSLRKTFGKNFDFKVYYDGSTVKVKPVKKSG